MPVVPTTLERAALAANLLPGAALDVGGTATLHAASTAVDLGGSTRSRTRGLPGNSPRTPEPTSADSGRCSTR